MTYTTFNIGRRGLAAIAAIATLMLVAACGGDASSDSGGMAGMESDDGMAGGEMDHSQHMSGAPTTREAVMLTAEQERALGVTYLTVERMSLARTIRTVGRVEASEETEATVTPKIEGFVEDLLVGTTGQSVRRGQSLLRLYSPELVAAQEQLVTAQRLLDQVDPSATEAHRSARTMFDAARRRLDLWDITAEQVDRLIETSEVQRTLTLVSPVDGIVLDKPVTEGQRVGPGTTLYRIADLSSVWVEGDLFEQDLQLVREGSQAHIEVAAYPGEHLMGRVSFVYPTVDVRTRTNRVRVTLPNTNGSLKPGMFATVFFDVTIGEDVLAVPMEAVIVTGERNLVFVHEMDGTLRPQEVVLGQTAGAFVEVLSGLDEGMHIVGSANFLIDAESRLGGMGGMANMPGMQHGSVMEPAENDGMAGMDHSQHQMAPDTSGTTDHSGHEDADS